MVVGLVERIDVIRVSVFALKFALLGLLRIGLLARYPLHANTPRKLGSSFPVGSRD